MDFQILFSNLTNPTLLFFLLGILATLVKSDLEIPATSSKFISLYLLFAIGFKGGQELSHSTFSNEIIYAIFFGIFISSVIPVYTFFILKQKIDAYNAGAIAAAYGSVSAVTFVSAVSFLEAQQITFNGYMIAVMALMESPAIIVGVILMRKYAPTPSNEQKSNVKSVITHSFVNGSVLLILGSLIIGLVADTKQAEGIKPFTTDIFKGFLSIFLLEMGMVSAKRFKSFRAYGLFLSLFAILVPLINGSVVAACSGVITQSVGNRFIFAVLAASASYIAVPAAMRIAAPKSDPGLYIPMALGLTFPLNITVGMPVYYGIVLNI
ncbi:MAG: sodium-dependent bicarbonate transport family permease [Bacteroidia bacterium]|nr:sodium-dependent bicarbonate transport family permease [Bacteroidia bacterium]MDW8347871.1 sodium-dependent bicarbonate transport family permease [Bacteroidia bacterium]